MYTFSLCLTCLLVWLGWDPNGGSLGIAAAGFYRLDALHSIKAMVRPDPQV